MAAVQDLLTCPLCELWFDTPKRLPCSHVYCCKHLPDMVQADSGKLKCPECSRHHDVPNQDVNEFPLDEKLQSFIDPELAKRGKCQQCKGAKDVSNCAHCDRSLCEDCLDLHKLNLTGLLHRLVKELTREYVKVETKDLLKEKQGEIHTKREQNDHEQTKIKEETAAMIQALEKRRDDLLLPFELETTLLEKQETDISQVLEAENFLQEMRNELDENDCGMDDLMKLKDRMKERKDELGGSIQNINQQLSSPQRIDFTHQCQQLDAMIRDFGQLVGDYTNMKLIRTLDGAVQGQKFNMPFGLYACPHTGHVYLSDGVSKSLSEYNHDGHLVRRMNTDFILRGITLDSKKRIILPDCHSHKVCIYDNNFELIRTFGQQGAGNGELNKPFDVVCDDDDNIYVSEVDNHRIQVFNANCDFKRKFGGEILERPFFLRITRNRRILVTDAGNDRVSVFTLEGEHERNIQVPRAIGICLDRSGYILITNRRNKTIHVFTPEYEPHSIIANQDNCFNDIYGIAITKSGRLFVTDHDGDKLHILQ